MAGKRALIKRVDQTKDIIDRILKILKAFDEKDSATKQEQLTVYRKILRDLIPTMTDQQLRFCQFYRERANGKIAAIQAGYAEPNAQKQASELLDLPQVSLYLDVARRISDIGSEVTADWVVQEWRKLAVVKLSDLYDGDGNLIHPSKLPDNIAAAVMSVKQRQITLMNGSILTEFEYKLHPKAAALDALGRHKGIYEVDNKQKSDGEKVVFLLPNNEREKESKLTLSKKQG